MASTSATPTPTTSTAKEDAAALERVRNRLASSSDAKLPQILSKLLPRLVARLQPSSAVSEDLPVDPHLIGILEHVRERILLNAKLIEAVWVEPLLETVLPPKESDASQSCYCCGWTRQLQYTLPILELALPRVANPSFLPRVVCILEALNSVLPTILKREEQRQSSPDEQLPGNIHGETNNGNERMAVDNDNNDEENDDNTKSPQEKRREELRQIWEQASWMVVEQIAVASNLPTILDWNLVGDDWDDFNAPSSLKKIQDYEPTQEERSVAGAGTFQLILDALTFDPQTAGATYNPPRIPQGGRLPPNNNNPLNNTNYNLSEARWQFRRQTDSIQQDYEASQRQRNAEHELARQNQRAQLVRRDVSRRRNPTEWNQAELRYWRSGLQRCLQAYAIQLYKDTERESILRIITGVFKPTSALPLYNRIKPSQMKKVNARKNAKAAVVEQTKSTCSLSEEIALLHLILGDAQVQPILDKQCKRSSSTTQPCWQYLELLGVDPKVDNLTQSSITTLRPLPQSMAQRVFSRLLQAELDLEEEGDQTTDKNLDLYVDLLYETKTVPSLQIQISAELYENIGAHTPPSMCWPVHFLWKLVTRLSPRNDNGPDRCPVALALRGYDAAIELLDKLQDVSLQRFQRQQNLQRQRDSHYRRIHEHRASSANRNPFVTDALQARSEAYQMVTRFMAKAKIVVVLKNQQEELSWNMAVRILNCMAFDQSKHTMSALHETSTKVLSVYRQWLTGHQGGDASKKIQPINVLLLPLLKACISASDWSRGMVIQWAVDVIYPIDPCISHTILACLSSDEVPNVAKQASEALQRLTFPVLDSASTMEAPILYWNLEQSQTKDLIADDLQNRITSLAAAHNGLTNKAAYKVLQNFDFSVEAATDALAKDWKSAMDGSKRAQESDSMEVDNDGDEKMDETNGNITIGMDVEQGDSDIVCQVCYDDIPNGEGFALDCNHRFCIDCWRAGLEAAAGSSSFKDLANFSCLHHECSERMAQEDVQKVAPDLLPALKEATIKWFVLSSPDYAFCPGPDCPAVATRQCPSHHQQQADCNLCSTSFCFQCGKDPHAPASCDVRRRYITASERVKAHEDAVEHKTIACPNCGMGITKNGGCNHMTCSQCAHEFCWICLSANWQDHVCNVYDSLNGVDDLQRIQFFRRRVDAHVDSADATLRLLDDFDNQSHELMARSRFCQDAHLYILKEAWKMLIKGRTYLANSYIAAYGMPATFNPSARREFEAHQSQLQLFVEQLSFLSDSVPNLYQSHREEDFQVRFRGLHFCTVAVSGYIQRVESSMGHQIRAVASASSKK